MKLKKQVKKDLLKIIAGMGMCIFMFAMQNCDLLEPLDYEGCPSRRDMSDIYKCKSYCSPCSGMINSNIMDNTKFVNAITKNSHALLYDI